MSVPSLSCMCSAKSFIKSLMQTGQHNVYSCDYEDDFCKSFQMYFASKFSFTLKCVHTE